jgi:dTDP-4-dehydrorhamnose 3,5-epimerase-like enzyme
MKLEHKPVNFEDVRGTITDIFVNEPKQHCTIILTKKGGVRGNHYHKVSRQHDFIVSGSFEAYGKDMNTEGAKVEKYILQKNDLAVWEPGEAHEFVALEDTVFITFVDGLRGGEDFEKDTFRLEVPLHEEYSKQDPA